MRSFKTVYTIIHAVHPKSVHIRFQTIAIRPKRFKYKAYMVKYVQTQSSTDIRYTVSMSLSIIRISNSLILSPVASAIVFYNYTIGVSSLKVRKIIKLSHQIYNASIF